MKVIGKSVPFIILSIGVIALVVLKNLKQPPPSQPNKSQVQLVATEPINACDDGFTISVDGVVVPYREVNLSSRVSGQILNKATVARAGEYVRKGDLLFEVDPKDYELEVRRLKETVKQAASSIEESDVERTNVEGLIELAEEQLVLQNNELERFQQLREKNATTASRLESARAEQLRSQNSLQTLKNQITMLNARRNRLIQERERSSTMLDQATLNLSRTRVEAPCDGIVMEDLAEQDDFVQLGAQLVRIEDTSKTEVRFSLRLDQLRWLWTAQEGQQTAAQDTYDLPELAVRVRVEIEGNHFYWPARLDRYDGAGINAATRTVPVIATVDDPRDVRTAGRDENALPLPGPPTLMRNTFVTVEIPVQNQLNLVTVPTQGLRPGERIWLVEKGRLAIRQVKVAQAFGEQAVLLVDPKLVPEGSQVIVSPLPVVVADMPLRTKSDLVEQPPQITNTSSEVATTPQEAQSDSL